MIHMQHAQPDVEFAILIFHLELDLTSCLIALQLETPVPPGRCDVHLELHRLCIIQIDSRETKLAMLVFRSFSFSHSINFQF